MMLGGDGEGDALGRRVAMLAGMTLQVNPPEGMAGRSGRGGRLLPSPLRGEGEREIPWGEQETRDLIAIRADLERGHPKARGNKTLWELVADAMRDRGYLRSPDQCKCKWKNLVNRYKGTETADPQIGRQCPFFDELNAVFVERAKSMHRLLLESESGASHPKKKLKRPIGDPFSDVFFDEGEDEHSIDDELLPRSRTKKTSMARAGQQQHRATTWAGVEELLQEVLQQQRRMEAGWREMVERRAEERRVMEQEWRGAMRELERERTVLEQAWREREEQRRAREERRAEKTEALLAVLVDKLIKDDE